MGAGCFTGKDTYDAPGTSAYSGQKSCGAPFVFLLRRRVGGSLTLEAAMAIPLFLFFMLAVMSFLMMLHVQMCVQSSMEDTARKMGKGAYLLQHAEGVLNSSGSREAAAGSATEADGDTLTLMQAGINSATIQLMLLSDTGLRQTLDSSRVKGGSGGLYTYASSYEPDTGILDIVVSYDYHVPWLPGFLGNLRLVQRIRSHVWTGETLQQSDDSGQGGSRKVYVTPTGTVYHTSADCHYLDLSIRSVSGSEVTDMRNASGARYYPCEECARAAEASGTVYITDYGTCWHTSLGCSGLKRTVQEIDIEEVGDLRLCSKCGKSGEHKHEE